MQKFRGIPPKVKVFLPKVISYFVFHVCFVLKNPLEYFKVFNLELKINK